MSKEPYLLQRIAQGDWEAYTDMFNYYLPKLSQYIYPFTDQSRQDTEEVIQEVFLKIWEKKETLVGIRSFDSYLFRMAKNKLLDLLQQKQTSRNLHLQYSVLKESSHTAPEQDMVYAEYQEIAKKAIDQLSPKLQGVFLLRTQEGLSLDEIASRLKLPKATVKKRIYLASAYITSYLRKHAEWLGLLMYLFFSR